MRDPRQLDQLPLAADADGDAAEPPPAPGSSPPTRPTRPGQARSAETVELNYPDPTPLATVVRDVSRWSRLSFVMEPTTNVKIQIFAASKLDLEAAWELFLASLSVVGLRAVQVGRVVKIVPVTGVIAA